MVDYVVSKIQIKRGLKADLPSLDDGELAFCTDTLEYFIGTTSGNKLVNNLIKSSATNGNISVNSQEIKIYDDSSVMSQLADKANQTDVNNALALKANQSDLNTTNTNVAEKADKAYVDTQIQSVTSGSPKGVYATPTALQTALPTGNSNIYLVTADGKWYYWSGTAWVAGGVYQSTGATNNFYQIALEGYLSRNLFNKLTNTSGRLDANGNVNATVTGYFTTDFIPVTVGSTYISNYASGFIYTYDSTKTKITSTLTNITASTAFTIPTGISYIRASFPSANLDTLQIETGTTTTTYDGVGGYQIPQERVKQLTNTLSINATTASSYTDKNANYNVTFTTNTIPTFTLTGTGSTATLTVAFPSNGVMYAITNISNNYKTFSFASQSFILASGETLYWDFDLNSVTKTKPSFGITLVVFTNGIFKTGKLLDIYLYQVNQSTNSSITQLQSDVKDSVPQTAESRGSVVSGFAADQGMDVVKEEIWVFRSSNSDHTGSANIEIYDKNTFVHKGIMTHNFGHAATVSYNALWDNLLIANGDTDNTVLPRLDFLPTASSYGVGSSLDFNSVNKISIEFFVKDGSGNVTKQIGGSGLVACFGESPYIVYMIPYTGPSSRTIYKVLLGTGTNDYSDSTGTDTSKWGTFISGKGTNDLNGTAKVIETYTGAQYGTSQGLKYHEGKLFYGVTQSPYQCKILELVNLENGKFKCLKSYKYPPVNPDNTYTYEETEDVAILDGRYLISGMRTSSVENLVLFPLYNEQGGKGSTGNRIALPFTCKTVPQIKLTPTSNVTDLYVSNVDTSGFTVLSASGGSGTFNWECKIS